MGIDKYGHSNETIVLEEDMARHKRRLSPEEIQLALKLKKSGNTIRRIAKYFGVNQPSVAKSLEGAIEGVAPIVDPNPQLSIEPASFNVKELKGV